MPGRTTLAAALGLVFGTAVASAATLDAGAVYGNAEGCAAVKSGDLGAGDFLVLTTDGLESQQWACQFVQVLPGRSGDLFVNAICYGEGQATPQTYAIARQPDDGAIIIATADQEFVAPGSGDVKQCEGVTADDAKKVLGSRM